MAALAHSWLGLVRRKQSASVPGSARRGVPEGITRSICR
ncbi:Uncharacterised protein [Mycobacteroides abscessus subsp. abscessus]|nr:Uncharacterised protein [Mycobacteroides abscessus subsp. abscessus]SKV29394.1 Uncharacterised protein [Mycobacteroides abscessus subsp. abscessus]